MKFRRGFSKVDLSIAGGASIQTHQPKSYFLNMDGLLCPLSEINS